MRRGWPEGKAASNFALSSALATAERKLREHETVALSPLDAEVFLEVIRICRTRAPSSARRSRSIAAGSSPAERGR